MSDREQLIAEIADLTDEEIILVLTLLKTSPLAQHQEAP